MALPAPAPPAAVPWELAGPGWGGACGCCTAAPSWLEGWAFPRVPSEPFAQRPCRFVVVTLGAEWGQECHPKLSRVLPTEVQWDPGAQPPAASAHTPARAAPFLSRFGRTDSIVFCARVSYPRKWGAVSFLIRKCVWEVCSPDCLWVGWGVGGGPAVCPAFSPHPACRA